MTTRVVHPCVELTHDKSPVCNKMQQVHSPSTEESCNVNYIYTVTVVLFLRVVLHRMDETLVMELNNKSEAAFFFDSVKQLITTAALGPRLPRIQLVATTELSPEVEFLAGVSSFRDSVIVTCRRKSRYDERIKSYCR